MSITRFILAGVLVTLPFSQATAQSSEPVDSTLPTLTIQAERLPDRVAKEVLSGEQLRSVAGTGGDPMKALQSLPGVTSGSDASSAPAIRGSGPDDNLYYIDGLPVGYLFHVGGMVSVLPADLVKDFNLFKSAFGPEYGDAIGAVLDVNLREPRTDRLVRKADISLLGASLRVEGPVRDDQAFFFSLRRSYFDLIAPSQRDENSGVIFEMPRYGDYQGKYRWDLNPSNRLTLHLNGADDHLKMDVPADSVQGQQEPVLVGATRSNTAYHTQALVWEAGLGEWADNRLALGHTLSTDRGTVGQAGSQDVAFSTLFLREQLRLAPAEAHEVWLGGSLTRTAVDINLDISNPLCTEFDPNCDLTGASRLQLDETFDVNAWELYAKDRWRLRPDLTLVGGLHFSGEDYLSKSYAEPRLGLEWQWTPRTLITAGWGRYNQFPQGAQVLREFGNPLLRHLNAEHSVLGVSHQFDDGWSLKAEAYHKTFSDFVVADPALNYINGASGHAQGMEWLVKKDLTDKLSGWFSLSLSESRRRNDVTGEDFPFEYDQPVVANLVGNYRWSPRLGFGARLAYHSGSPYSPVIGTGLYSDGRVRPIYGAINSERLPDYYRLDLRAEQAWSPRVKGYVELINVLNRKNVSGYQYNADYTRRYAIEQLPMMLSFGVEMDF